MQEIQIDKLGQFPILQFVFAIVALGGLVLAVLRGTRDRKTQMAQLPEEARWFFDGPLAIAINLMRDIKNHQTRVVEVSEEFRDEQRKTNEELRDIKNAIDNLPSARRRR